MTRGIRLGVLCAGALASLLSPTLCAAAPPHLLAPSAASSAFYPQADDLTVAWIARDGAIRGYALRVACAPGGVACPDREWFVARQDGAELASYVVRIRVPAGATMVRVGLEAVDEHERRLPLAERYLSRAAERLQGRPSAPDASQPTLSASLVLGSFLAPRPLLPATLEQRDRALGATHEAIGAPPPILLFSRGPPAVTTTSS